MARSLGLTLYNLGHRREAGGAMAAYAPRPSGRMVWMHAPALSAAGSVLELARRLVDEDGVRVVLTCPEPLPPRAGVITLPPPADGGAEVRGFLDHWAPEAVVMAEGELRPAALSEVFAREIPAILVDGREPRLLRGREGWYPGLMRSVLGGFRHVLSVDEASARAFRRAGAPLSAVEALGRMEEESAALPCLEAEREVMARLLATRPVWLAADVPADEIEAVLQAHRSALRLAHRLLLILVPAGPELAPESLADMTGPQGWNVARRSAEEEIDGETEILLAEGPEEYGLWYRLAPVTYLGGSLTPEGCRRNPMEAAALGSALIHGPRPGAHGAAFGRLGAARAARGVGSAGDLAEALGDLLSPDRAARLAQAAWGVVSDGAEVTGRVLTLVRAAMDGPG